MAGKPTSHWWQDQEEPGETSGQASERVAVGEPELEPDTWAELEAEALRRSLRASVSDAESVSIYIDRSAALRQHSRNRIAAILSFGLNMMFVAAFFRLTIVRYWELPVVSIYLGIFLAVFVFRRAHGLFPYVKRRNEFLQKSEEPAVRLSPQGIHIGTPEHWNVMLPWAEIASISTKKFGKYGRLEIDDVKNRRFLIEDHCLPVTAGALYVQIATYKAARQIA